MKKDHLIFAKFGLWARKLIVPSSFHAIAHVVNTSKKKKKKKDKKGKQTARQQKLLEISNYNIKF